MFDRSYSIAKPAEEILAYLKANQSGCQSLRRRAVIYNSEGKWILQACIVEGVSVNRGEVKKEASRCYSKAVLFEDWLTLDELQKFIEQILYCSLSLGEYWLDATNSSSQWAKERLPLSNDYMSYAGYVWTSKFHDIVNGMQGELLAPQQPYYPDLHEAVKDWLPFTMYHGHSDSRKGEIILLLPETRAYLEDAIPHGDSIDLCIAGAEANNLVLEVKGAWWDEEGIHHFTEKVSDGHAQLIIPEEAKRLDYVLVDADGAVYDYQLEDAYRHTGLGRKRKTDKESTAANLVREACHNGEGSRIEFKPFIYPENDKLKEIIQTVVAFANAQGGRIFLGINDGCELEGIDEQLKKWTKAEPDEVECDRYLGVIRSKIRDELRGEVQIDFGQTVVDGRRIVVIEVTEAIEKPVTIQQDRSLYIRRGASNTKASPEEWKAIISAPVNSIGALWMERH
jgi:hypothetical protein